MVPALPIYQIHITLFYLFYSLSLCPQEKSRGELFSYMMKFCYFSLVSALPVYRI